MHVSHFYLENGINLFSNKPHISGFKFAQLEMSQSPAKVVIVMILNVAIL